MHYSKKRHHFHSWRHRTYYAAVMFVGTAGMHWLEKMSWSDAFYFMSMIATAQGSSITPASFAGKVYASLMAFVSVGGVLTAIGFLVGPLMGKLFKVGFEKYDDDMESR